jgi:Rps23 Pro-64 3,4-dihydroxylase Tpa1-like proline 4-hydroxylase
MRAHNQKSLLFQLRESLIRSKNLNSELLSQGYCVIDNIFENSILQEIQDEIVMLDECCKLESSPNSLQGKDGEELILTKPGIYEWSLVLRSERVAGEGTMEMVPRIQSLWENRDELVSTLQSSCEVLSTITALDQVKVAIIRQGGAFAVHTDTLPTTGRTLSITIYLNDDYRQEEHGGELRVLPFPYESVDVAPLMGRMVLFSSCNLFHRVLPSRLDRRFCLSLMFYGSNPGFPCPPPVPGLPAQVSARLLSERRALTPLVFEEEFKRSIAEAFGRPDQDGAVSSAIERLERTCEDARGRLDAAMLEALRSLPALASR